MLMSMSIINVNRGVIFFVISFHLRKIYIFITKLMITFKMNISIMKVFDDE